MAKAAIHIWHDPNSGQIVAIGKPSMSASSKHKAVPKTGHNQSVLEAEVEEGEISRLHHTHIVDIHKKTLVKTAPNKK
jgi:hypothetical protein